MDLDKALSDVRIKVDEAKRLLPDDVREPTIREFNSSDRPVLTVSISSDVLPQSCLLYTSPSPRDQRGSRMPASG